MQTTEFAVPAESERVAFGRLLWVVPLAAISAAVANVLVYFVGVATGAISLSVLFPSASGESPLTIGMVVATSVVGAVGATVVFALVGRFSRHPIRTFRIVAAVVLALSFIPPLTIPAVPISMVLTMELMHLMTAFIIVGLLTTLARRR
jgi:hypothetical protein